MITLGEATASAVPIAHQVGKSYVDVYNASFTQHVDQRVGKLFDDVEYDTHDPEWLDGLRDYLNKLRTELDELDRDLQRRATVTRIA